MRKLLFLLAILPSVLFAQTTDSWVNFKVQYDFYAPSESNFFMVADSTGDTVMFHAPTIPYEYLDTTIDIISGDYTITLTDSYGDGWLSNSPAWFKMQNDCQGLIINYDPLTQMFFTLDTLVNILPCAPPVMGCTDSTAINYDSTATADDGSCLYVLGCMDPVAENYDSLATQDDGSCTYIVGCTNTNATNYDSTATASWHIGQVAPGGSCNLSYWTNNFFGIDTATYYANPSIFASGTRIYVDGYWYWIDGIDFPTNCNYPTVLVYVVGSEAACDGNIWTFEPQSLQTDVPVGTNWYISPCIYIYGCTNPLAFNYDSTAGVDNYTCEFIEGCTDSTSVNYNPVATMDDNSCIGGGIICSAGQTELTIQIKLDQFTGETGWILSEVGVGIIDEAAAGTYNGYPSGAIITYTICIDDGTNIEFLINDTYGDGIYAPGGWIVYTDCDTISTGGQFGNNFTNQDFGYSYSDTGTVSACSTNTIIGCMDPSYLEFNPIANQMDSALCLTSIVYGCNDITAFNYDSTATGLQQNPGCDNILTLTDWAGDGWNGAFLYVTQGSNYYGPYTVDSTTFVDTITLNTTQQVNIFFYSYGQSQSTSEQCMFAITNPFGNTIIEVGANPYTNPIASYNQFGNMYSVYADCGDICIDRVYGCLDPLAFNFDSAANTTDNSCYYNPGCMDEAYLEYHTQGYVADYSDSSCLTYAIFGCMDTTMFNYDQYATVNWTNVTNQADPCIAKIFGCLDPSAFNFDPLANTEDYSCVPFIYGCMDMTMWNYDPSANTDNGSCIPFIYGCTDSTALNYNVLANTDNGTCIAYLYGCTDSTAFNYNQLANTDDGTCIPVINGCTDTTMFNYNPLANTNSGCIPFMYGCTDPTQFNYDILANTDDSSCVPFIYGCTDPTQFNYDPSANTSNGSCLPYIYGCTDSTQYNYDPLANTTNSSCIPFIYGCTDSTAINYDPLANTNDLSCIATLLGCTDSSAINYNALANTDDGTCIATILGCTDPTQFNYDSLANTNSGCIPFVYGCMNPLMFNYDINANTSDSSCVPFIYGCTDILAWNYDSLANTNVGCISFIYGCTDPLAFNYNPAANTEDSTCIPVIIGCTDPSALNYDSLANTNNGCIYPVLGCTDPTMFNYSVNANTDDGTCIPFIYGCTNNLAINYDSVANTDNGSCILPIPGCTDPTMFNYNALANVNDSSCIPFIYGCTDVMMWNYDILANTDNGSCLPYIYGCTDSTQFNYDPTANTDNGSCVSFIYGCTDNAAFNFDPLANTLDNSCCYIGGCTDSLAVNYNANACYDDGSCITPIVGCTDVAAYNYNPGANVSDSTACNYDAGCYGGPGIPYWLNDGCYAWVISVDDYCCTDDWDASCIQMYDYCQLGWPTAIEDISALGIIVYPNPTTDIITIETRLEIEVEVYDIMGKLLINKDSKRIDLSDYPNGVYNLILIYNSKKFTTKVIKQ